MTLRPVVAGDGERVRTRFGFLSDGQFCWALALALPATFAFAMAPQFGITVRAPATPILFLIVYPLLEELVFRGLLQGWLLRQPTLARPLVAGISGATLLAAALFALAHLLRQPWPWALATFFPGVVFGWARQRHGSVLPAVVLHVAYNGAVYAGATLNAMSRVAA